jgi:hypothetical protein
MTDRICDNSKVSAYATKIGAINYKAIVTGIKANHYTENLTLQTIKSDTHPERRENTKCALRNLKI